MRVAQVLYKPLDGMDGVPAQEFLKGELAGMETFIRVPELSVEQLEDIVKELEKRVNDGSEQ